MSKSLFKSKTFWLNVAGIAAAVLNAAAPVVPPPAVPVVLGVLGILNRLVTDKPVSL